MDNVRYIKSFSKGQITIPKEMRKKLGLTDEFWLKLDIEEGKIIAEPVKKEIDKEEWRKKLLAIKGVWIDEKEIKRNREQVEKRLKKLWP